MENTWSKTLLDKNIWIPKYRPLDKDTHNLTRNVLKVWDAIYRHEK